MKYEDVKERILKILEEHGELATPEIAELLNISDSVIRHHLRQLALEGQIRRRRLGKRLLLWCLKKLT